MTGEWSATSVRTLADYLFPVLSKVAHSVTAGHLPSLNLVTASISLWQGPCRGTGDLGALVFAASVVAAGLVAGGGTGRKNHDLHDRQGGVQSYEVIVTDRTRS
jgi:hypothetical protein